MFSNRSAWMMAAIMIAAGCASKKDTPSAPVANGGAAQPVGVQVNDIPPPSSGEIAGTLAIAPALKEKVQAGDVIFVMARHPVTAQTVAAAKLEAGAFPMPFRLTGENVMRAGASLSGQLQIMARVDKDGDAITKQPGDVVGRVEALVAVPAEGVVLTLDQTLE